MKVSERTLKTTAWVLVCISLGALYGDIVEAIYEAVLWHGVSGYSYYLFLAGGMLVFVMVGTVALVLHKWGRLHPAITWSVCLIVLLFVLPNIVESLVKAYKLESFMDPRCRFWGQGANKLT